MPYVFYPVKEFTWEEDGRVIAVYAPGLSYTVRLGNTKLDEKVKQWEQEGKVVRRVPEKVEPKKQGFLSWLLFGKEE